MTHRGFSLSSSGAGGVLYTKMGVDRWRGRFGEGAMAAIKSSGLDT